MEWLNQPNTVNKGDLMLIVWPENMCNSFVTQLCQNGFCLCWFSLIPDCMLFFHQAINRAACSFDLFPAVPLRSS